MPVRVCVSRCPTRPDTDTSPQLLLGTQHLFRLQVLWPREMLSIHLHTAELTPTLQPRFALATAFHGLTSAYMGAGCQYRNAIQGFDMPWSLPEGIAHRCLNIPVNALQKDQLQFDHDCLPHVQFACLCCPHEYDSCCCRVGILAANRHLTYECIENYALIRLHHCCTSAKVEPLRISSLTEPLMRHQDKLNRFRICMQNANLVSEITVGMTPTYEMTRRSTETSAVDPGRRQLLKGPVVLCGTGRIGHRGSPLFCSLYLDGTVP